MTFSIKSCVQTYCLFTLLLLAALLSQGKEKIETPHKPTEGKNSVPTLHIPWIYRSHPMLSKPAQLLSLDPIRFSLHANKQVITVGEEVEITITAQLLDIPASTFFVFEEQRGFALKLLLPEGFIQTSGDYQEYIGGKLTASNSTFTKRLRGVFTSIPENPCFVLLRGAYNANSSSIFEQKHRLCLTKKSAPQATRVADCVSPWIAVQNKTCGTSSYSLNISVSQEAVVSTNVGQVSGTAPNHTITNIPLTSELILTATNCDKQVSLIMPVAPCQNCTPPTIVVGALNCGSTTYSFGVDMFDGVTLNSNYGTIVGTAPHFAINDISLGQNITLTATSANGCQSTIIVSGAACGTGNNNGGSCTPPILTPITPQTICYGGSFYSVNTSVSNAVEVYYQWYNDNGSANNNTNPIEGENRANLRSFPTSPGEYKYKVVATSSANSTCTASQSVTLTVHASPTISSTTATNPNCVPRYGGTVLVTGAGGSSLLYSKDDGGNWMDLTGINAQNEIARNTMLYTPQKDIAKVKITLEEGFGLLPGGEYTGEIRNESSPPTFDDLAAGTYNIRVKDENGCISAPSAVTLSNPNAPAIFNVTGGGTCLSSGASAPIYLSGSVTGVNYYLLRNGIVVSGAIAGTGGQLYFANHSTDGTYTVMASNALNSCSSQMNNSAIISSGTPPAAPANSEGDKIFCASKTNLLSVSVGAGKTADWYSTSTGGTPVSGGTGVVDFTPSTAGVYYVETRDIATKCKSTTRTPVTLYAAPTLSITGASSIGCENPTALLSAETNISLPTSIPVSYTWKKGGNTSAVATTSTFSVTEAETYTVSLSYEGCTLTSSKTISNLDPQITLASTAQLACVGDLNLNPTITNTNTNTSYEWSGPDGFSATTSSVNISKSGTYTILVKKNGTTPCGTKEIFVGDRPQTPEAPELIATELSIDPENASTLIARGCPTTVQWSYVSNDPIEPSTAPITQEPQTVNTSLSIVESVTTPELPLSFQTTLFQTSATYTASCMGACGLSTSSLPITIFKNVCGIKIEADKKAVTPNTPVTLVTLSCEPANITWSTGQTGTRSITVTPLITTTYFAVCKLPNQKTCTDYIEIKTIPVACQNFVVNASSTEIEQGQPVTLTASGCSGSFIWKNDLGTQLIATVYLNTTTSFTATCSSDLGTVLCEQTVIVKVKCDIVVKITPIYDGLLWGIIASKQVNVWASCNNSPVFINGERAEWRNYGSKLLDGTNNQTIVVSCGEGAEACTKTIQVPAVTRPCQDFSISATTLATNLILTATGCSEGNTVTWDNGMSGGTITIPLPAKSAMFKAICGRNGCENYYTYYKKYVNENFTIRQKPDNDYPITLWPLNCEGTVSWDSNPIGDFSVDSNKNLTITQKPTQTTTYTATCKTDDNHITQRSFTIQAASVVTCISIVAPQSIEKGAVVTLTSVGCVGTPFWKKSTNITSAGLTIEQWLASMTPIGSGQSITDQPLVETIYWVECDNISTCFNNHIVKIKPCNIKISATKTILKAGELTTLAASGCPAGTINWVKSTGELLGWGAQITLQLVKNTTVKAICDVSKCENTIQITVPSGNPEEIICENLILTANPNRPIYKDEPNTITIKANGCTGGTVTWNGPLLAADTKTQYPNHIITLSNLQQAATYTAVCNKTSLPPTQATISITAEIRFTLKAVPEAVEAGKTTLLTAEGCVGGTINWTSPISACGTVPCSITSPVINDPVTFTANCTINGQNLSKSVNVYLKSADGSIVYKTQCKDFRASYGVTPPIGPTSYSSPPYPKNSRIELYSSNCSGTVRWNAVDSKGDQSTLTGFYGNFTHYPQLPTTYTATCEVNAQICATRSFYIPIHQSSCGENGFSVTWTEAKPGVPSSNAGQLSGAQTGSNAGKFYQESVLLGVSLVDQNGLSNYSFTISASGCRSLDTDVPGIIEVLVNGVAPLSLQKIKAGDKISVSCKANPTTFPYEECYQILCVNAVANNAYSPFFVQDCGKTTARQGVADSSVAIQQTTSTVQTTASGCTAAAPLKDLMAGDYKALICNNINALYDENGLFSVEKTKAFLLAIENYIKTQSVFSSYTLVFPTDYTTIANSIKDAAKNCANVEAIAKTITTAVVGTMPVDDYKSFSNAKFVPIENAARDALDTKYVFLTPDLKGFVVNTTGTFGIVNCSTVSAVPAGTVPGFKVNDVDYCAVFDPATGLYSYRKGGLLTAPASTNLVLTGPFTAKTKVVLVWGLGNCPINGKKAIVNSNLVDGKTKEQIAYLIEAGLPNTEDIKCGIETIKKPRLPMSPAQGSYLTWLMSNPPVEDFQRQAASLGSIRVNIFYTHQSTTSAKRTEVSDLANHPLPNEINLWIDLSEGEYKYEFFYGSTVNLTTTDRTNLAFIFNKWESIYTHSNYSSMPQFLPFTVLFEALGQGINQVAKLPERFWDCQNADYFLKDLNLTAQEKLNVALIAGLWDGVVDNIAGIPSFIAAMMDQNKRPQLLAAISSLRNGATWSKLYAGIEQDFADPNACKVNHTVGFWIVAAADVATGVYGVGRMASKADVLTNLTKLIGEPQELFLTLGYHASHITRGSTRVLGGLVEIANDGTQWAITKVNATIQKVIGISKITLSDNLAYDIVADASGFGLRLPGQSNIIRATELMRDADNILIRIQHQADDILVVIRGYKTIDELFAAFPDLKTLFDNLTQAEAKTNLSKLSPNSLEKVLRKLQSNPELVAAINQQPALTRLWTAHKAELGFTADQIAEAKDIYAGIVEGMSEDTRKLAEDLAAESGQKQAMLDRFAAGNAFSDNVYNALSAKNGTLFEDLATKLNITPQQLGQYQVLKEIPLNTTGGFMKADILLIKRNQFDPNIIDDAIVIENKLSVRSPLTNRQIEGFGAIIDGQTVMYLPYAKDGLTTTDVIPVSKEKIFKCVGNGTVNISFNTLTKITKPL